MEKASAERGPVRTAKRGLGLEKGNERDSANRIGDANLGRNFAPSSRTDFRGVDSDSSARAIGVVESKALAQGEAEIRGG